MLLMILGCHNVIMSNHSTFVLGYLLLQGYDVTGEEYSMRVISLLIEWLSAWQYFIRIRGIGHIAGHFLICSENLIFILQETGGIFD